MTRPTASGAARPPGTTPAALPSVPAQSGPCPPSPAPARPAAAPPAPRRTAFAEGVDRLRAGAVTAPGRLRLVGALLAVLVLAFGAVTAWQTTERSAAADEVLTRSQPLSSGAAGIYRSLADANTAASSAFLAGGEENEAAREGYEKGIRAAAEGLVAAAAASGSDASATEPVTRLNRLLPEYKGLVERARTYNRQGYPVGGAYLRYADEKMQKEMLPAAQELYEKENRRLDADYAEARARPWAAIGLGVLALGALGWAQHREYRRTNRVLNRGLVTATAATTAVLLWLATGQGLARSGLGDSYDRGIRSLNVLHDARIASLRARADENLTLVSRGAETTRVDGEPRDAYDHAFEQNMKALGAGLAEARRLADDEAGRRPVAAAEGDMAEWRRRHAAARAQDETGDYRRALDLVIGGKGSTAECFDGVDAALARALGHETREFREAASGGRGALRGLAPGAGVLAALGAAGVLFGIGRRLSEYR
ncbi:hypothetical protein [Streptomyces sp. AD55]|uniref:hypothetical protein n=1 Tax=Streptomyces sp. AD55 TaxID=3242895 RepID=UPI0035275349